jgi:outer membrane protein assembly factor BamB
VFAILCLDGNLTSKWSLEADTEVLSTPGIGPDGTVYVGSTGGYLYAIKGKPLAVDAPWPKFGYESRNSGCAAGH